MKIDYLFEIDVSIRRIDIIKINRSSRKIIIEKLISENTHTQIILLSRFFSMKGIMHHAK